MHLNFEDCLDFVLRYEGGYVNHPNDPGGPTNMGITQKTLSAWRGVQVSAGQVKALGKPEAAMIYKKQYWTPVRGDELPLGVDLVMLDYAVNSGASRAIKALQKILGVKVDGQFGLITLDAAKNKEPRTLCREIIDERAAFLRRLSTFSTFGKGWMARLSALRKVSNQMIQRMPVSTEIPVVETEKPKETDTKIIEKKGFWEKLTAGGGVLATMLGAATDWKILAVLCGAALVGLIAYRILYTEDEA